MKSVSRADWVTLALVATLVAAAAVVGLQMDVQAATPPLYALWQPHAAWSSIAAVAVAVVLVVNGVPLSLMLPWRWLLAMAYATAVAWTVSLTLVDGWDRGVATRLTSDAEYLWALPRVSGIRDLIRTYASHILNFQPDAWNTQPAGHPPGALLVFVVLDRIGLGGGVTAALVCIAVGALAAVAVPSALRSLGDEAAARAVTPFVVLFPGAVWVGVSADGLFLGVTALAIALLAAGLRNPPLALAAGVLLGFGCFLSYGLVLMAPIAFAVLVAGAARTSRVAPAPDRGSSGCLRPRWGLDLRSSAKPALWALVGAAAVFGAFALAGFWWYDGYTLVKIRYYQGVAADRPYLYWVWANLAALALSAGPAAFVALRRAVSMKRLTQPADVLSLAAALAIVIADLSGLSKAEVERIWLPFAVWLLPAAVLLPQQSRRGWLAVQAATALAVNHLLATVW
jgi:methylthioxylose transferase